MRELIQVGQQSYYIKGFTNAGIYRQSENEVYVIDPGTDENEGREVEEVRAKKRLEAQGYPVHPLSFGSYGSKCVFTGQIRLPCVCIWHGGCIYKQLNT